VCVCVLMECLNLQFLLWPLEALQKTLTPIDPHVKMANFTAEINMFTVWC